jgi:ABC-type lipoprotein release transport system permease subunit
MWCSFLNRGLLLGLLMWCTFLHRGLLLGLLLCVGLLWSCSSLFPTLTTCGLDWVITEQGQCNNLPYKIDKDFIICGITICCSSCFIAFFPATRTNKSFLQHRSYEKKDSETQVFESTFYLSV